MSKSKKLVVVFIHGFKGTDSTFGEFPSRLEYVLSNTLPEFAVECIIFPVYDTKGDLAEAVERFTEWLTDLTVQKECSDGVNRGKERVNIVLCGHSMGGLLAADSLLKIVRGRPTKQAHLWPKIIACLAFDTPYFGMQPTVIKNGATKAAEYASAARTVATGVFASLSAYGAKKSSETDAAEKSDTAPSESTKKSKSSWGNWAPAAYAIGGALLAGGVGAAYYKRDDLGLGYTWATDHLKYVRNLWDEDTLKTRMENLIDVEETSGVIFRAFYTTIPPALPTHPSSRTFIILPPRSSRSFPRFFPAQNSLAHDEIQAHTGMFEARSNDGYYELGLQSARFIRDAVVAGKCDEVLAEQGLVD